MRISIAAVILALGMPFFVLPALNAGVFLSPDETATAVSADGFARLGTFRLNDPILAEFPWAHPRSYVSMGSSLVPVGFLGWPLLLSLARAIGGNGVLPFVTPLLAMSVAFPLWSFFRSKGRAAQMFGLVTWFAFPIVILYANRGLFPNLPVVCFAIWAAWFAWHAKRFWHFVIAGVFTGLALLIRPTEGIWILPWVVMAMLFGETHQKMHRVQRWLAFVLPIVLICMVGAWFSYWTYGSPFAFGYLIREVAPTSNTPVAPAPPSIWPFGFHPRNVWWNVRVFLLGYLGPWSAIGLVGIALAVRRVAHWKWIALGGWTFAALALFYGQGIYLDNIQANQITLANSYMRYLLPLAVPLAFAAAHIAEEAQKRWKAWGIWAMVFCSALFVALGWWTACSRDAEGLVANQRELQRYAIIRENATKNLHPTDIILSDRSDKVFFPSLRAISPMPSFERLMQLKAARQEALLVFIRTLTAEEEAKWNAANIKLVPVLDAGNETLYVLQ